MLCSISTIVQPVHSDRFRKIFTYADDIAIVSSSRRFATSVNYLSTATIHERGKEVEDPNQSEKNPSN